jgi:hypothetical protein
VSIALTARYLGAAAVPILGGGALILFYLIPLLVYSVKRRLVPSVGDRAAILGTHSVPVGLPRTE